MRDLVRLLCAVILAALLALPVFAAGQGQQAAATGQVNINYAFWGNPDAIGVEQDIIDAYHQRQDQVRITPVVSGYSDYHAMLLTQLAAGAGPDVMRVDSYYFQDFISLNALRRLDDLVARDNIDLSVYYPQGIVENSFDGRLYGLPWGTSALYMFINLPMFEAAGIPVPDFTWTLDDFERIARELTRDGQYGFSQSFVGLNGILPFVWAEGGDLFDESRQRFTLTEPEAIRGLERYARLYRDRIMPEDSITAGVDAPTRWFVNNQIAMRMGAASDILSTQAVEGVRFEVINMPTGPGSERSTIYKSNTIGINNRTANVESAWDFVLFLRGPSGEGEELYMRARRIPPTIDDQRYWALYADPNRYPRQVEANSKIIAERYGRLLPLRAGWLEIESLVMPEVQGVVSGAISAQAAMDRIAPAVQQVMDRTR